MTPAANDVTPVYGETNPTPEEAAAATVKRFGSVIGLRPEKEQYYRELHANTWPAVRERVAKSNIRNYSIYFGSLAGERYLFSYFEYTGSDFDADMQAIADDPETQRWWQETDPCQKQLPGRKEGANWTDLEMVFLMD
jgi:L-rhamnose mutarotase